MAEKLTTFLGYIPQVATTFFDVATTTMEWVMGEPLALVGAISCLVIGGIGVAKNLAKF